MASTVDYRLKPLIERFGDHHISDIRTADIEDFVADMKTPRIVNGIDGQRLAPASINRTLGILRHMLNWPVGREYLDRTPFRRGTEVLVRMELEDNKRRRRISEQEEAALLAVASPYLRSMIIAALERAWTLAVLEAHGVDPRWRKGSYKDLDTASLQRLRTIDLHWHDLRHEYASRLVEKGVPLAQVRGLLGHASILTTEALRQPEDGSPPGRRRASGDGQDLRPGNRPAGRPFKIFQDQPRQPSAGGQAPAH